MSTTLYPPFVICHSIVGRVRVRVESVRASRQRADALQRWLEGQATVRQATVNPITASVILLYDSSRTREEELLRVLARGLDAGDGRPPDPRVWLPPVEGQEGRLAEPSAPRGLSPGRVVEVLALTGFAVYSFVRGILLRAPLPQGPLSSVAAVSAVGALPLLRRAWSDVRQGRIMSLFPFLAGTAVVGIFVGEALTALEVVWILRVGMLLEEYVEDRSRRAIRQVLQTTTRKAFLLVDGVEVDVPVSRLRSGDTLAVHAGERIAADGTILRGEALVDESLITGRSEAEHRGPGGRVFAGTLVQEGFLVVRAEGVGPETYLARTLRRVEESLRDRAPAERRADLLAARLMRFGAAATLGTLALTGDVARTFTVALVMSCPCATVLAASTAVTAAIANAARNGILIKGGLYLERVGEADRFCFDKTGTVTDDCPHLVDVVPRTPWQSPEQVLAMAAAAEAHAQHPLGRALVKAAEERGVVPTPGWIPEFVLGKGVRARRDLDTILVGNRRLMEEEGVDIAYFGGRSRGFLEAGNTVLYVARNGKAQGMIAVMAGAIRPAAGQVLDWLRADGVSKVHLITGDTEPTARAVAGTLGFDGYQAELLPEEKAGYVDRLMAAGSRVVVVGDGVNDALAFARAEVGVAMGAGGAEVAIEAADVALADSRWKAPSLTPTLLDHRPVGQTGRRER